MSFRISLVGRVIEIHSTYKKLYNMCQNYIISEDIKSEPDIIIDITDNDLQNEFAKTNKEQNPTISQMLFNMRKPSLECIAAMYKIAGELLNYDTILLHGVVISRESKGFMFSGSSGIGKSTRAMVWREVYPESSIINGDKPFIHLMQDGVYAYGSPWCGKEGWNENTKVPLQAIFLIERSDGDTIETIHRINNSNAFPELLKQTLRFDDKEKMKKNLNLLEALNEKVGIYKLHSGPTKEAIRLAYNTAQKS